MNVADVVPEFADAFGFEEFNRMQREALPAILERDSNVVASAPTASGKTALAELAICKTLQEGGTALFIAPLRALTNEKEAEWERFESLGYSVYVVTGERELNPRRADRADILVMTPEKTDSATRKHDSPRYSFIRDVDCCVIDEVHLLDSDGRGSVLEVTISRLRRLCDPRIVALSATMPNVDDVAAWLDAPPETTFDFDESYRPVKLHAGVRTYTHGDNAFADKYRRLFAAIDLAEPHIEDGGQALVFVSSRQDAVRAAKKARDTIAERDIPMGARGDYDLHNEASELSNETLRKSIPDGVAFHHAGLSKDDRDRVEAWFREGTVQLLFSTSTLAWGVNLPARCVVIRDTKYHDPLEGEIEMSPLDVLQMLGRAGRPGYDDVGYGWVVCDRSDADRYRRLLESGTPIESGLAVELDVHLNAEIAMGTIDDLEDVLSWLETTFYYQRAQSAPEAYDLEHLREGVSETLKRLVDRGFVETDDLGVEPTRLGQLASKYYLELDTAEAFAALAERDRLDAGDLLDAVAAAAEFDSVSARHSETDAIENVLRGVDTPLDGGHRKVRAILEASMAGETPGDLRSDAWIIRQNARRMFAALCEFLEEFAGPRAANLTRRVEARIETGIDREAVALTAIEGIAQRRAETLSRAGITTPEAVLEAGVEGLTRAGLTAGVAERILDAAKTLPRIDVDWTGLPESIDEGENALVEVGIENHGGGERLGVRVTVNGVEMHKKTAYVTGETTVPIAVFGSPAADELEYTVEVTFPQTPLLPVRSSRRVVVS